MAEDFNEDELAQNLLSAGEITEEESRQGNLKRRLSYITVGFFSFLIGAAFFLPLDKMLQIGLQKVRAAGYPVTIAQSDLSLGGNFTFERVSYKLNGPSGLEQEFKIAYADGSVDLWKLAWKSQAVIEMLAGGVQIPYDKLILSGGNWEFSADIEQVELPAAQWKGPLGIKANDAMLRYDEYETLIKQAGIKGKFAGGSFTLEVSEVETTLARLIIQGNVQLGGARALNLRVVILPEPLFGEKYADLKELLTNFGYIQPDGKIELTITGTLNSPRVEPVSVLPGSNGGTQPSYNAPPAQEPPTGANSANPTRGGVASPGMPDVTGVPSRNRPTPQNRNTQIDRSRGVAPAEPTNGR